MRCGPNLQKNLRQLIWLGEGSNVLSIAYLLAYSDTGSILLRIRIRRQHFQACSQVAGFGSANAKFRG